MGTSQSYSVTRVGGPLSHQSLDLARTRTTPLPSDNNKTRPRKKEKRGESVGGLYWKEEAVTGGCVVLGGSVTLPVTPSGKASHVIVGTQVGLGSSFPLSSDGDGDKTPQKKKYKVCLWYIQFLVPSCSYNIIILGQDFFYHSPLSPTELLLGIKF